MDFMVTELIWVCLLTRVFPLFQPFVLSFFLPSFPGSVFSSLSTRSPRGPAYFFSRPGLPVSQCFSPRCILGNPAPLERRVAPSLPAETAPSGRVEPRRTVARFQGRAVRLSRRLAFYPSLGSQHVSEMIISARRD